MNIEINKKQKQQTNTIKVEDISKIKFEDVKGKNTYIETYIRVDEDNFVQRFMTLTKDDKAICPFCGRFHPKNEECGCGNKNVLISEDTVIELYEANMDIPDVDIYVNNVHVKIAE